MRCKEGVRARVLALPPHQGTGGGPKEDWVSCDLTSIQALFVDAVVEHKNLGVYTDIKLNWARSTEALYICI